MSETAAERTKRINSWLVSAFKLPSNATVYFLEIASEIQSAEAAAHNAAIEAAARICESKGMLRASPAARLCASEIRTLAKKKES